MSSTNVIGERAVVIGAGLGGLLAARVLADHFERVTVVDRDALPAVDAPRRAVPQGRHCHMLLPSGQLRWSSCCRASCPNWSPTGRRPTDRWASFAA